MKKLGLTLVAAFAFSTSILASGTPSDNAKKWNGAINKNSLNTYLKLSPCQAEEVATICDYLEDEMKSANNAKKNQDEKIRKAIYGNLKLMKMTLDKKQYTNYVRIMGATLRNKGIALK